ILFFSTTVSFLTSNSNGYQLTAFDYLSIALGPVLGLAALAIARDLQRLTVFTILIITTLFLPISAFLPPGSDSHSETLLRIFALNLFSLVLLIEMVVGPSSIPFINVGPEVEQPYNISQ